MTRQDPSQEPGPWILGLGALLLGALAIGAFLLLQSKTYPEERAGVAVAEPDGLAARLRLAHRYFDARDHQRALAEYLAILDQDPANVEALSHAGWIAFESGNLDMGERLVRQSLRRQPDGPEALWFLANIRLYGRQDPETAVPPLRALLARQDLSPGFRGDVERLMTEARE
ncbi:MAG: tetratricopeptide repeat protein [Egibacteraceae bacterium]